jgi:fatty acid desaturase
LKILDKLYSKFNITPNRQKVFSNIYWAVLGKVVNILSGLLVGILVARYLGPEQYGLMSYVISYVTLFSILATFGFDNIEIRELSKQSWPKEPHAGSAFPEASKYTHGSY